MGAHEMNALSKTILRACPLFRNVEDQELQEILESDYTHWKEYRKEENIFNEGDTPTHLFILMKGSVSVNKIDVNGKRSIMNIFTTPGTVFGEIYLYLEDHPYDYVCTAEKNTTVLRISKTFFDDLNLGTQSYSRKIINNMLMILSQKSFFLNQKILILSSFSLRQKIANYLLRRQDFDPAELPSRLNREEMAAYIGSARPSLSRELSRMAAEGLIQIEKDRILILDEEGLKNSL